MRPENIERLRTLYPAYYHRSIDGLPDAWVEIVDEFLLGLEGIGDLVECVEVRFERKVDGLRAFVFPVMFRWSDQQLRMLIDAQRRLFILSQEIAA